MTLQDAELTLQEFKQTFGIEDSPDITISEALKVLSHFKSNQ